MSSDSRFLERLYGKALQGYWVSVNLKSPKLKKQVEIDYFAISDSSLTFGSAKHSESKLSRSELMVQVENLEACIDLPNLPRTYIGIAPVISINTRTHFDKTHDLGELLSSEEKHFQPPDWFQRIFQTEYSAFSGDDLHLTSRR